MATLRKLVPALCLATSLAAFGAHAETVPAAAPADPAGVPGEWHRHGVHGAHGGMFFVLRKLGLTADQRAQIKGIFAGEKGRYEALRESARENRHALAATPPTDPGYPALIQTAQTNAASRIAFESETWAEIYGSVLTKQQQEAIPGIVAAAGKAREARMAAWKAQHGEGAAPASD